MVYELGGKAVEIKSVYDEIHAMCREYLTEKAADFTVETSLPDIDYEREKSASEDRKEGIPVRNFSDSYLETLAVYRKIADRMTEYDTILFHGSCVAVDGEGYLFTAKSGTGKSTHTRMWIERFGERAVMVNDDKPLIGITDKGAVVYGTPWDGKHHLSTNISVPLKAICILERGAENHIEAVGKNEAYPLLLQQTHRPQDTEKLIKTLELTDKMGSVVKLYRLWCNTEKEAALISYNGMKGK